MLITVLDSIKLIYVNKTAFTVKYTASELMNSNRLPFCASETSSATGMAKSRRAASIGFQNQSHPAGHVWSSLAKGTDSATDDNDDFSVVVGKKRRRVLTAEANTLRTTLGNDESGSNNG